MHDDPTSKSVVSTSFASWKEYLATCKPRVVAMMLFIALVGMILATPHNFNLGLAATALLGIALVAGSAAAINQISEHHIDALMLRTQNRPLPSGELSSRQVLIFATIIGVVGTLILVVWVNWLTASLTVLSLVGYAFIYTRYLKYATPQNIVIGGIAGATPPLLGWTAMTNHIAPEALLLVLIIFTWTPPHFWALALHRKEEYAQVAIPMLPVTHGERYTCWQILLYTILLSVVSLLPVAIGMGGIIYAFGASLLNLVYLYHGIVMLRAKTEDLPRRALSSFVYSIIYLILIYALLLFDTYLRVVFPYH